MNKKSARQWKLYNQVQFREVETKDGQGNTLTENGFRNYGIRKEITIARHG